MNEGHSDTGKYPAPAAANPEFGSVHFELHGACNFHCTFCPYDKATRPKKAMSTEIAFKAIEEIARDNLAGYIQFGFLGEPTLNKNMLAIARKAREHDIKLGMFTNGALLSLPRVRDDLLAARLHSLTISYQVPTEEFHATVRGTRLDYDNYEQGIIDFLRQRIEYEKRSASPEGVVLVDLAVTFNKLLQFIYGPGEEFYLRAKSEFVDQARTLYDKVHGKSAGSGPRMEFSHPWQLNSRAYLSDGVMLHTKLFNEWNDSTHKHIPARGSCFHINRSDSHFVLSSNGDVFLCCRDFNGRTAIGNIMDMPLWKMLNSPRVRNFRKGLDNWRYTERFCRECRSNDSLLKVWAYQVYSGLIVLRKKLLS